jgi:uncharacterized protein
MEATPWLELWDWRRRIFELYASIRAFEEPRLAWQLWRESRDTLFREHAQSPLDEAEREGFRGLSVFDYDPGLRFAVALVPVAEPASHALPGGKDGTIHMSAFARTSGLGDRLGCELTLFWLEGYGGGVFLPLRDATSGAQTFGGGRYLLDTVKGADLGHGPDGRVVLDFNFAYNPSCAYSDRWICPLAPPGNTLPAPVQAGERLPG